MNKNKHRSSKSAYIVVLLIVLLVAGGLSWWRADDKTVAVDTTSANHSTVKGTLSTPIAQHPSTPSTATNVPGGVTASGSQTSTSTLPPSSEWASSSNGDITLQEPIANSTISSGQTISGLANVSQVEVVLTDNSVGIISQGTINVVNGKFSGVLNFTPHASSGTLQVYYPNPSNGAEEDIINLNVNYNT